MFHECFKDLNHKIGLDMWYPIRGRCSQLCALDVRSGGNTSWLQGNQTGSLLPVLSGPSGRRNCFLGKLRFRGTNCLSGGLTLFAQASSAGLCTFIAPWGTFWGSVEDRRCQLGGGRRKNRMSRAGWGRGSWNVS